MCFYSWMQCGQEQYPQAGVTLNAAILTQVP